MSDTWIVQWYSRRAPGQPEVSSGRVEYDNEADARKAYASPETQAMVGGSWRVELHCVPAPVVVESTSYREVEQ